MTTSKAWIATVVKSPDSDELMVEFDSEMCRGLDWKEGDTLKWSLSQGKIILTKVSSD